MWDKKLHKERNQKAVELVLDEGYAPAEVALRFGINVKQIYNWVSKEKQRRKLKEKAGVESRNLKSDHNTD